MVNHWDSALAKPIESLPSTKPTVLGAVPWAITLSGFSLPVVKIGTILSKYLIFLVSIACRVLAGKTFFTIQYSMSPMSKELGWVTTRCTTASESSAFICRLKPRSALAFSAISLNAETPVPHWRSTMFLLFCAQIVGAPMELPTVAPARPAAPFRILRRPMPFILRAMSSPWFVTSSSKDVHVLGYPGQNHRLAGCHRVGVEARLRHYCRQGLEPDHVDA